LQAGGHGFESRLLQTANTISESSAPDNVRVFAVNVERETERKKKIGGRVDRDRVTAKMLSVRNATASDKTTCDAGMTVKAG
jgi:hypothetical protein